MRGPPGGLNASVEMVAVLLGGKGYGRILFETVGVGQSEVEVIERTDPAVVVVAPGFGAGDPVFRINSLGSAARRLGCCGGGSFRIEPPRMLLCFANRSVGVVGEPFLVSGGELVVVVEASFEE